MNDLILDGPVDVAPECSSVPVVFFLFPLPSLHHRVGEGPRWCFPHLNAIANTFLDIWGLLYACRLLILLTSYPAAAPQYFHSPSPPFKNLFINTFCFKIILHTVASFKTMGRRDFTLLKKIHYTFHKVFCFF